MTAVRRLCAWLWHQVMATPEESAWLSSVDDELRGMGL